MDRSRRALSSSAIANSAIAVLGAVLAIANIPGLFTIDEAHYLASLAALRHGSVALPDTAGLPPAPELLWFDPMPRAMPSIQVPVAPTAPPLYAPVALPFAAVGGFSALILLNVAAFVGTCWLVFLLAVRIGGSTTLAGWAAAAFALGGYSIEYALGMWPQSLSAFLVIASLALVATALRSARASWLAAAAGLVIGIATGIRYQNLAVALGLLALVAWRGRRRALLVVAFLAGLLPPLAAASAANAIRLENRNPVTKGGDYVTATVTGRRHVLRETAVMVWARLVDYSARPFPPPGRRTGHWDWLEVHPETGAPFARGVVKKAWFQSAPWLALALVALGAAAWLARREPGPAADATLAVAAVCAAQLGLFAFVGPTKDDQFGFNQRYLLELVAPLAVFLGVALDGLRARAAAVAAGVALGAGAAAATLAIPIELPAHSLLVMRLPLVLAALLVAAWLARSTRARVAVVPLAAAAIAWAAVIHVGSDLRVSREIRRANAARADVVERALPADAAVVAWVDHKVFLGRLLAERDLVVVSAAPERDAAVRKVVEALLARGTRVFAWTEGYPADSLAAIAAGHERHETARLSSEAALVEIR